MGIYNCDPDRLHWAIDIALTGHVRASYLATLIEVHSCSGSYSTDRACMRFCTQARRDAAIPIIESTIPATATPRDIA